MHQSNTNNDQSINQSIYGHFGSRDSLDREGPGPARPSRALAISPTLPGLPGRLQDYRRWELLSFWPRRPSLRELALDTQLDSDTGSCDEFCMAPAAAKKLPE
eukprot:3468981-Lingulodinium_polyedra.AAC.1